MVHETFTNFMLNFRFDIKQKNEDRMKIKKKFDFKREIAIRYSTQKPMQQIVDSVKAVGRSVTLIAIVV